MRRMNIGKSSAFLSNERVTLWLTPPETVELAVVRSKAFWRVVATAQCVAKFETSETIQQAAPR
jgi:hypothetical protein